MSSPLGMKYSFNNSFPQLLLQQFQTLVVLLVFIYCQWTKMKMGPVESTRSLFLPSRNPKTTLESWRPSGPLCPSLCVPCCPQQTDIQLCSIINTCLRGSLIQILGSAETRVYSSSQCAFFLSCIMTISSFNIPQGSVLHIVPLQRRSPRDKLVQGKKEITHTEMSCLAVF